jgi:hypothetical protein
MNFHITAKIPPPPSSQNIHSLWKDLIGNLILCRQQKKKVFSVPRPEVCEMPFAYSVKVVLLPNINGTEYPNETPVGYRKRLVWYLPR